jgi:hypothetical protein
LFSNLHGEQLLEAYLDRAKLTRPITLRIFRDFLRQIHGSITSITTIIVNFDDLLNKQLKEWQNLPNARYMSTLKSLFPFQSSRIETIHISGFVYKALDLSDMSIVSAALTPDLDESLYHEVMASKIALYEMGFYLFECSGK